MSQAITNIYNHAVKFVKIVFMYIKRRDRNVKLDDKQNKGIYK